MVREGVMPPAESAEYIANNSKHVKIDEDGIYKLSAEVSLHSLLHFTPQ